MTAYEKRNEKEESELQQQAELLVRGEFKDDEEDEGYTTTRWLNMDELVTADKQELLDTIFELEKLLEGLKSMVAPEDD